MYIYIYITNCQHTRSSLPAPVFASESGLVLAAWSLLLPQLPRQQKWDSNEMIISIQI